MIITVSLHRPYILSWHHNIILVNLKSLCISDEIKKKRENQANEAAGPSLPASHPHAGNLPLTDVLSTCLFSLRLAQYRVSSAGLRRNYAMSNIHCTHDDITSMVYLR